jgi:hypothetical protein
MAKIHQHWTVLPHGPIEKLSEGVWRVEGKLDPICRVMAIARCGDGTLVVHNGIALGDAEMAEIDAFGKVSTILVPNGYHRLDAKVFADRYPEARVLCPSGAKKRVAQVVTVAGSYEDFGSDPNVELVTLRGTKEREGAMIVRGGDGTSLVFNDAIFNMPHAAGFTGFVLRRVTASTGGPTVSRVLKWLVLADKAAFRAHLEELAKLPDLKRIIVSHHETITDDPAGTLARVAAAV